MEFYRDLDLQEVIKEYMKALYPFEGCGLVVDGKFEPADNIHADPANHFRIDAREIARAGSRLQAIVHSHPDSERAPTESDMRGQIASNVPWGIVQTLQGPQASNILWWGDSLPRPDLLGRIYISGVQDCWSLCRDHWTLHCGITIPDYPRNADLWRTGRSLYEENVETHAFEVPLEEIKTHDIVLLKIRATCVNHGGIYLGNDQMLHHPFTRLSTIETLSPWGKYIHKVYRLKELAGIREDNPPLRHTGRAVS